MTQSNSIWFTWWWQPSWIQPFCTKLWLKLVQSDSNSFILTQLDDGSHLEFCHLGFSHFAQKKTSLIAFWLNLMMAAILNSAILDSAILHKKNFTCSFWLNFIMAAILNSAILDSTILHKKTSLVHSDSTWWWQPSWSLPCWIQTLPSWIQTPFYLLSDSLKNTLTPFWLWLKLIQSDSNSFILT